MLFHTQNVPHQVQTGVSCLFKVRPVSTPSSFLIFHETTTLSLRY